MPGESEAVDEQGFSDFVDTGHERVSRYVSDVADRIDHFFVDPRIDEELNRSRLRLRGGVRISEATKDEPVGDVKLNLQLPRIAERLSLILSRSADDQELARTDAVRDDDADGVTLRYFFLDAAGIKLNVDGSVRWRDGPDPIVRLRGRRDWVEGKRLVRLTVSPFWSVDEGAGVESRVDLDRRIGTNRLARFRNEVEYSESSAGVEFASGLFFFHSLSEKTGYGVHGGLGGHTEPSSKIDEYIVGTVFRRAIHKNWLFVIVEPRVRFLEERNYDAAMEGIFRLEFLFGEDYVNQAEREIRDATGLD